MPDTPSRSVDRRRPGRVASRPSPKPARVPMAALWKHIEHRHLKPQLRKLQPWRRASYGDIHVRYKKHLDGGGRTFGRDFIPFFDDRKMPRQARVFEWCTGPGFIAFSLLAYGFADTL